jgi:hypothetical protein
MDDGAPGINLAGCLTELARNPSISLGMGLYLVLTGNDGKACISIAWFLRASGVLERVWTSLTLTNGKQGSASFLRLILRTKPGRTRGPLIATVLRDVPLEDAKNMVIPNDMFLPIGTFLQSFWVSA